MTQRHSTIWTMAAILVAALVLPAIGGEVFGSFGSRSWAGPTVGPSIPTTSTTTVSTTTSATPTTTIPPGEVETIEVIGLEVTAEDTQKLKKQLENSDMKVEAEVQTENKIKDQQIDVDHDSGSGVAAVTTSTKEGDDLKSGKVDVDISEAIGTLGDVTIGDKKGHRIMFGEVMADDGGGLNQKMIVKVIQANLGGIRNCYERVLKFDANVHGRFNVEIGVAADGAVSNVKTLEDTVRNRELTECMVAKIQRWRFPESPEPFQFSYPFNFVQSF
ncbi:MAG: AgmX/PglI C-terminal domain-containing protein [Deltaproteobacteria bacterium]|nr:AgmX/PglI C-terminal domain-containing protein [Deltaproteobacteria bacterium]